MLKRNKRIIHSFIHSFIHSLKYKQGSGVGLKGHHSVSCSTTCSACQKAPATPHVKKSAFTQAYYSHQLCHTLNCWHPQFAWKHSPSISGAIPLSLSLPHSFFSNTYFLLWVQVKIYKGDTHLNEIFWWDPSYLKKNIFMIIPIFSIAF